MTAWWKQPAPDDPYAHLDVLLELTPDGVMGVDGFGDIVVVNDKAERMFAATRDELVGQSIETVLPHVFSTPVLGRRTEYLEDPHERDMGTGAELVARRTDGSEFPVEIGSTPHKVGDDQIVLLFIRDISVRRAAEDLARERQEALKALGQRMITAQEEDRARIARDLHDDISQRLHAAAIGVQPALDSIETDPARAAGHLEDIQEQLDSVAEDTRRISHELHPALLQMLGLVPAIEGLCDDFESATGIPVNATVPESIQRGAANEVALGIYRITQEALRNIEKHAQASAVAVELSEGDDSIVLAVRDDGAGFDADSTQGGLGLASIRERARLLDGDVTVDSAPKAGTRLTVTLPVRSADR